MLLSLSLYAIFFFIAGVVPSMGHALWIENEHFKKYFCMGPLTRYADDLTLIMKVLTAKCDRPLHLDTPVDLKKLKVYYHEGLKNSLGILPLEPEIKECISKTVKHFAQYGNHTEEVLFKVHLLCIIHATYDDTYRKN